MTERFSAAGKDKHLMTPSPTPSRDVLPHSQDDSSHMYLECEDYRYSVYGSSPQQSNCGRHYHVNQNLTQHDTHGSTPEPRDCFPLVLNRQATMTPPAYASLTPNASPTPYPSSGRPRIHEAVPFQLKRAKGSKVSKKISRRSNQTVPLPAVSFSEQLSQAAWNTIKVTTRAHIQRPSELRKADQVNQKGNIKRPWNTYVIYRWAFSNVIKTLYPGSGQQDISRVASTSWKLEPSEVKDFFGLMADEEKLAHKKAFPAYSYQPNKPNDTLNIHQSRAASVEVETEGVKWDESPRRVPRGIIRGPVVPDFHLGLVPFTEEAFYDSGPVPTYLDAPPMQPFAHDAHVQEFYDKGSINPSLLHSGPYYVSQSNDSAYPPLPPVDHLISPYHEEQFVHEAYSVLHDGFSVHQEYSAADLESLMDPDDWECHPLSFSGKDGE